MLLFVGNHLNSKLDFFVVEWWSHVCPLANTSVQCAWAVLSSLEQRNAFAVNKYLHLDAFPLVFRIFVAGFLCGKIALNNYNDVFFPLFPQSLSLLWTSSLNLFPQPQPIPQPQPLPWRRPKFTFSTFTPDPNLQNPDLHKPKFTQLRSTQTQIYTAIY